MVGGALHIVQIEALALFRGDALQQVRVAEDGADGGLDVVCDGEHQFLACRKEVFGA